MEFSSPWPIRAEKSDPTGSGSSRYRRCVLCAYEGKRRSSGEIGLSPGPVEVVAAAKEQFRGFHEGFAHGGVGVDGYTPSIQMKSRLSEEKNHFETP